ncbi:MAG: Toluene tolerance family protein [Parcubacteria group bacterium GW2011_GWA2_47_7]|nr:MAG: Toluene tolerance family protein [Parcubacteria group bacterium GW2011_GWA2_47_7]
MVYARSAFRRLFDFILLPLFFVVFVGVIHASELSPDVIIQTAVEDVIDLMRLDQGDEAGKRGRAITYIEDKLSPHIDYEKMMRQAMGRNWRLATEVERAVLTEQFQALLVNAYAGLFLANKDQPMTYMAPRMRSGTDVAIPIIVSLDTGGTLSMVIFMERTALGWMAYNIEIEHVSIVLAYQSNFRDEVSRGGISGLINTLKRKNSRTP